MSDNTPGWQSDPTGKHDHRYWDGSQWTDNVSDAGVASTDAYEPAAVADAGDPTVADTPVVAADATAAWPTTPGAPAPPPPYVPTNPVSSGGGGSKKGLLVGGGILAAVAIAVVAFLALSKDDDKKTDNASSTDTAETTKDTTDTTEGSGGEGAYGSDPALDALYDECEGGDYAACDELSFGSPTDSEYEAFGDTCGERNEPSGECVALYEGGGDSGGLTDSADSLDSYEEIMADTFETTLGVSRDEAECLAGKLREGIEEGSLTQDSAITAYFDFFEDCDINPDEIGAN